MKQGRKEDLVAAVTVFAFGVAAYAAGKLMARPVTRELHVHFEKALDQKDTDKK